MTPPPLTCTCGTCPKCRAREGNRRRYHDDPRHRTNQQARVRVHNLIRRGLIQVPDVCSACGQPGEPDSRGARGLHAHHAHGYSGEAATDVTWLCRPCHAAADRDLQTIHPDQMTLDLVDTLPSAPAGDEPASDPAGPSDPQEVTP
jgi:hypothetical protein